MEMASSSTSRQSLTQPENAFDGFAPSSAPKSTEPWDIFINHRGCDVKHTLAATIYEKLHSMGLHVFLDKDALQAGDSFPAEIQHAIASATLDIAIFSPNYAQSAWCLAELSFMLKTPKKVIPIFYHVDSSDLRWIDQGKGKYAQAFSEHEKKGRYTPETLGVWKKALNDSSFLHGYQVNNNKDEATVLKDIVNDAIEIMKKKGPLWVAERPVGLDELVQGFESVAIEETVKITGIVGMGGCGKTTLAKELFRRNFSSFERRSFVFDVRDAASRSGLPEKQKKLLADLGVHHSPFDHVDEGKVFLANHLSSHRALIVLDDVGHIDHLNALLPIKDNLASQSMIVVTSRELGVLISWGLSSIYRMPGLNTSHAEQLFCWHAFLQPTPPAEFETLVHEFLKACNGLSLSLKVLGAQLYGRKSTDYWKSLLHKILRILPSEIKERLQVSYDALDEEEREMFLDVACFLIGEEESRAMAVWDGSGWSGLHGLETLVNKCMVEVVKEELYEGGRFEVKNRIRMHDHLRDMGRDIASRHTPYRFWCTHQIDNMEKHSTEIKLIRGIQSADAGNLIRLPRRLRFLNGLQILSVKGNEFTKGFASLSKDLVWLRWEGFPHRNFPSWLILKNLRVFELIKADELEELWQENADPPLQLTELILKDCQKLQCLPSSIGRLQHLKSLVVDFYGSRKSDEFCGLHSLPACFGNLTSLREIRLSYCKQLITLPDSFSQLIHLTDLDLSHCEMLSSLPDVFCNLTSLRNINLEFCEQLSNLPDSFSQLIHLEVLELANHERLSSLPAGFCNLTSLRKIHLKFCNQLSMLPVFFSQLIDLEDLDLSYCEMLSALPAGFGNLTNLTNLHLQYCKQLSTLPDSFGNLTSLRKINLGNCEKLSMLPDSFSQLINLEVLDLSDCQMISSLPTGFGNLTSLRKINLQFCVRLSTLADSFTQLIHLEDLNLSYCKMLSSLPAGFGNSTSLRNINLQYCNQLSALPDSFSQLIHLTDLDLLSCQMLSSLPNGFDNLTSLRNINLQYCNQLGTLPDSFSQLIHLTNLDLLSCQMLSSLPNGFDNLTSLRNIDLRLCKQLRTLPDSFSQLIDLEDLDLSRCEMLSSLPNGFGNLTSLKKVRLRFCKQLRTMPDSFSQLIHLTDLHLLYCKMLSSLPETLPVSLTILRICSCNFLKNVSCISGLINLETLKIWNCLQIEEFPSFSDLASLSRFEMWNCPKVEQIEGLEHAKSLQILNVQTCWEVPGIQSLEKMKRLEKLKLKCDSIPALKPCIESIKGKECPRMMGIQVSVNILVGWFRRISLEFPDLLFTKMKELTDVDKKDAFAFLWYVKKKEKVRAYYWDYAHYFDEYIFDEDNFSEADQFYDENGGLDKDNCNIDFFDKEFNKICSGSSKRVMWGKRERVAEAFHRLLELLE